MEKMNNYLEQLAEARIQPDVLQHALDILQAVPQIQDELENPTVPHEKKEDIIRKIFPEKVRNFILELADDSCLGSLDSILKSYMEKPEEERTPLECVLEYVTAPSDSQLDGIRKFLKQKYPGRPLEFRQKENQ